MHIWLVTVGEPLPIDKGVERLLRAGILANTLQSAGHRVTWWTSTFNHIRKEFRFDEDTLVDVAPRYRIRLLHSIAYKKNVSLRRVINHLGIARKFRQIAPQETGPDIILCSMPPPELSLEAVRFGRKRGIPVVLDVRDLWPDVFLDLVPRWARPLGRLVVLPIRRAARLAFAGASAVSGVTSHYVEWGVRLAGRSRRPQDREFPMGYCATAPAQRDITAAEAFWAKFGIERGSGEFIVCFFGTFGRQFDIDTVIEAARNLDETNSCIRFVLCGRGDTLDKYKVLARGCKNVIFPGWVKQPQIWTLLRIASLGLAPYVNTTNFLLNLANKPIEYFSAGLPVVSSVSGVLGDLLSKHECGVIYSNGNGAVLAELLLELCNDRERLRTMSANALNLFEQRFVAEKVYGEMCEYLENVRKAYRQGEL